MLTRFHSWAFDPKLIVTQFRLMFRDGSVLGETEEASEGLRVCPITNCFHKPKAKHAGHHGYKSEQFHANNGPRRGPGRGRSGTAEFRSQNPSALMKRSHAKDSASKLGLAWK